MTLGVRYIRTSPFQNTNLFNLFQENQQLYPPPLQHPHKGSMTTANTSPDILPPDAAMQSCHTILRAMDRLETRLLRLVDDEVDDPDFVKLARGVGALAQFQSVLGKRDERNAAADARKERARRQESGLGAVKLTESDRRRLDAEAAKLRRRERAANDNVAPTTEGARDAAQVTAQDMGDTGPTGLRVERGPPRLGATSPASPASKTPTPGTASRHEISDDRTDRRAHAHDHTARRHPAGRDPDT